MVAALFVRHNSVYKTLPDVDAWDRERDAWCWPGGMPAIVHPPCAQWGTLRHMARVNLPEKALAIIAVQFIRTWGGVLEHPWRSTLWRELELPQPAAAADRYGGWTLPVNQHCFGHRAEKRTKLYIVGCAPRDIPAMPIVLGKAQFVVGTAGRRRDGFRKAGREIAKSEREHTPLLFAEWLVDLARRCKPGHSLVSGTKNQAATWSPQLPNNPVMSKEPTNLPGMSAIRRRMHQRSRMSNPRRYLCVCGWRGTKPIRAEVPTCPDCGRSV